MTRHTMPRDFYIPEGAREIKDERSDAVAYAYSRAGGHYAMMFFGKQSKPVWHHRFADNKAAAHKIVGSFEGRRQTIEFKKELRAKRNQPHNLQVGHVLYSSWGYEQTNIDWYQVVKVVGKHTVDIRQIAAIDASKGNEPWMTGKCLPDIDNFTGPVMRKRVSRGSIKIASYAYAYVWDGRPRNWTAYH